MKSHALVVSSIAASLLTLAAAPALALTHLEAAQDIADNIDPADNAWGSPCSISWTGYTATTNGACLFSLSLMYANGYTTQTLKGWWGSTNPGSHVYHDQIVAENHFDQILYIDDILPGDLIAIKYGATSGTSMIVELSPVEMTASNPIVEGTTQYVVGVIDSTSSPHWTTDSRYHAEADGSNDQGIGRGDMRFYVDENGEIVGHTWSLANGTYYDQSTRNVAVGRFVP